MSKATEHNPPDRSRALRIGTKVERFPENARERPQDWKAWFFPAAGLGLLAGWLLLDAANGSVFRDQIFSSGAIILFLLFLKTQDHPGRR